MSLQAAAFVKSGLSKYYKSTFNRLLHPQPDIGVQFFRNVLNLVQDLINSFLT